MSDREIQIHRLADELTRLVAFVPTTKDELSQWHDQAERFRQDCDLTGAPHFLWHYLSDADTRMKDDVYAEMQNGQIRELLEYLKRGVMPTDEDLGIVQLSFWNWIRRWFR